MLFSSAHVQATESELGDVDLSGLPEAAVDSEEEEEEDEDLERASDALLGRDLVRECLEKEPADRNDDDIGQYGSSSSNSSSTNILSNFGLWRGNGNGRCLRKPMQCNKNKMMNIKHTHKFCKK